MKKLLIVLGGGGHTEQMLKLVSDLGESYSYEYVIAKGDFFSENKIKIKGKVFYIFNPRKMEDNSLIKVILKMVPNTLDALRILIKTEARCFISCGPALCLPLLFLGKVFGKRIVFIESWSRVYSKSMSGKLLYFFSDLFFVQWEELKKVYPKSVYAGRLG